MEKSGEKVKTEELRVEKLREVHSEIIKKFKSYEKELADFLVEDALNQQDRKISVTYLWFLRKTNELVAYITLSPDCVKLKNIDSGLIKTFRDKGINYKSLPAIKIGRLCVDDGFLRRGLGTLLVQFTIDVAKKISNLVGCRFIYLDAKRNEDSSKDAIHFYANLGFQRYKDRDSKETPLYMDILQYLKELADQ